MRRTLNPPWGAKRTSILVPVSHRAKRRGAGKKGVCLSGIWWVRCAVHIDPRIGAEEASVRHRKRRRRGRDLGVGIGTTGWCGRRKRTGGARAAAVVRGIVTARVSPHGSHRALDARCAASRAYQAARSRRPLPLPARTNKHRKAHGGRKTRFPGVKCVEEVRSRGGVGMGVGYELIYGEGKWRHLSVHLGTRSWRDCENGHRKESAAEGRRDAQESRVPCASHGPRITVPSRAHPIPASRPFHPPLLCGTEHRRGRLLHHIAAMLARLPKLPFSFPPSFPNAKTRGLTSDGVCVRRSPERPSRGYDGLRVCLSSGGLLGSLLSAVLPSA
ncbi:hypothetical protein B0H17DRAFT_357311 [Mycena rosella]|uniref:Uncharacterized protein n=1 Tax=Mycena rosella TaxID=1033263 RepID=A0AAD7CPR5_MYCRO|nr:hypothetical protein B0H17DRAFT_357311 [Mycena rosella]